MSFNAEEAKKLTAANFAEALSKSEEWITKHMDAIVAKIKERASEGKTSCEYEIDMDMDPYRIAKTSFIANKLIEMQFKVRIETRNIHHTHKDITLYQIDWS